MNALAQPFDWGEIRCRLDQQPWRLFEPDCSEVRRSIGLGFVADLAPHGNFMYTCTRMKFSTLAIRNWLADTARYIHVLRSEAEDQGLMLGELLQGVNTYLVISETKDVNDLVDGEYFTDPMYNQVKLLTACPTQAPNELSINTLLEDLLPTFHRKKEN